MWVNKPYKANLKSFQEVCGYHTNPIFHHKGKVPYQKIDYKSFIACIDITITCYCFSYGGNFDM